MSTSPPAEPQLTLNAIDTGLALVEANDSPDRKDYLEQEEAEAARLRNRLARSHIKSVKADRKMRKKYASQILRYLYCYSGFVGALTLLSGWRIMWFELPDAVLTALVGSTAIAAIGLVGFIARGLFRTPTTTGKD